MNEPPPLLAPASTGRTPPVWKPTAGPSSRTGIPSSSQSAGVATINIISRSARSFLQCKMPHVRACGARPSPGCCRSAGSEGHAGRFNAGPRRPFC